MAWKITFYSEKVEQETLNFPSGILANFLRIAEMIQEHGPFLGRPYVASMGGGLFEIRSRGKEGIGRSLYCTVRGEEIVVLHSFIKKTQKTPKRALEIARKRMKEVKK